MKSFKMKALAVAVLGLAGLGMAGSAFAVCPTIAATSATPGGGGAWTSQTVTSAAFISSAGLNGTACGLSIAMNSGAASNTKGFVTDASPQNEPRYRARFYVNTAGMTNLSAANRQFRVFSASATTNPGTAGTAAEMVIANIVGGSPLTVRFLVGDTTTAGVGYKIVSALVPNTGGNYRVEFDLTQGAPGSFRYWVSDAATATTDAAPTGTQAVTNSGWSGVKQVNLGLFGTSTTFRANVATQPVIVDEFDSRRQTFIGL